jgi:hypothetical protein
MLVSGFLHEPFLDRHQPGLLELGEVAGQVALGQPRRGVQEEKSASVTEERTVRIARRPGS